MYASAGAAINCLFTSGENYGAASGSELPYSVMVKILQSSWIPCHQISLKSVCNVLSNAGNRQTGKQTEKTVPPVEACHQPTLMKLKTKGCDMSE